ncbi:hypothetical protein ACLMJK_007893 [Lecanora helva]
MSINDQMNDAEVKGTPVPHPQAGSSADLIGGPEVHQGIAGSQNQNKEPVRTSKKKKTVQCRYFGTKSGCRAGDICPFIHDPSKVQHQHQNSAKPPASDRRKPAVDQRNSGSTQPAQAAASMTTTPSTQIHQFNPPPVPSNRIVPKPIPTDPHTFQITQLQRRFSPTLTTSPDGTTTLAFSLMPSDPDFPFDLPRGLECVLHVPSSYPSRGENSKPSLEVRNEEMGAEWRRSVERGFAKSVERMGERGTLLGCMNALDRQLEGLLGGEREIEVEIIPNQNLSGKKVQERTERFAAPKQTRPPDQHSPQQIQQARDRRETETRQLEARLGRSPLYSKSPDGIAYTLPLTPRKHADLSIPLRAVTSINLFVPQLYPLQHCRVEILGVDKEAASVTEKAFERKVKGSPETTLMGHVNFLAQNMHVLATEVLEKPEEAKDMAAVDVGEPAVEGKMDLASDDREHVIFVPRPPEWSTKDEDEDEDSSKSEYSDSYDSGDEDDNEDGGAAIEPIPEQSSPESGISLSFPSLELYSIELLELISLCLTVKCTRCKTPLDVSNLHHQTPRSTSCNKCAVPLSITYRREFMHANSVRAGYLDLEGCTPVDMLPSTFLPTCSSCSTPHPAPGVVSVRGESTMAICLTCHKKLTFKLPDVKFLLISTTAAAARSSAPLRKKPKESLGIVAGQELPRRGRCTHYGKSYRWFRFSCCAKVFPCDRCHDEGSDHPNEHANRMICGWCSREQNYRPEECGICRGSLVKKAGSGFWEGGKGTRDKARMSRKDPRKYKRRPGGAVAKKVKAGGTGKA